MREACARRCVVIIHVFLEEVVGVHRQGEPLLEQLFGYVQPITEEAAALALQRNPRCLSPTIKADAPVFGQRLLRSARRKHVPAAVAKAVAVGEILPTAEHVGVDARRGERVIVGVCVQRGVPGLAYVAVSGVQHALARRTLQAGNVVVVDERRHALDAVVGEAVGQVEVKAKLGGEAVVAERERMGLLADKVRVALAD